MREVAVVIAGVAFACAWLAIWAAFLHMFGFSPFPRKIEDRATRRQRLKGLGKLRYVLAFGVLGPGFAFGLAMITMDFFGDRSRGWVYESIKFAFYAVFFGLFQGFGGWRNEVRDPVPFPPDYPPVK
jgi:hypothetical protein